MTTTAPRHELLLEELRRLAGEAAATVGVEIVEITLRGPTRGRHLRIDIDRAGPGGASIDDCATLSRALAPLLESAPLLAGSYVLEVSTPGLDRPICSADDFRRNAGRRVTISTRVSIADLREFHGTLGPLLDGTVTIVADGLGEIRIPLSSIALARPAIEFDTHGTRK